MRDIEEIIDDVVNVCQEYCDENDIDVRVEVETEFLYYLYENVIGITLATDETQSKYFMKNAFDKGLAYDCGDFIMSLFHEIGHHYTIYGLNRKQKIKVAKQKSRLNGFKKADNFKYFNFLDERLATEWAINYINRNKDKIGGLAEKLIPLFAEIELED